MSKILIVEDDKEISQIQRDYLERDGYETIDVYDGEKALEVFTKKQIDLVILDINLPKLDGIEVCKKIRKESGVPILMVTARTKEIDEILGLNVGADDYIKKPFSPRVLVSRVKALLARPERIDHNVIKKGDLKLDIETRVLAKNNEQLTLTSVQFNILQTLMMSPGKVFERYELIDRSSENSDMSDIYDRTMDSHIKNIRKVIEEDPKEPKYILTVRGVGYKFNEKV